MRAATLDMQGRLRSPRGLPQSNSLNRKMRRMPLPLSLFCGGALLAGSVSARLHFVSLGGFGRGDHSQKVIAETLRKQIHHEPISFVLSPGSSFMEGVSDLNDRRWKTQFEDVYHGPEFNLPFFAALGNNDWDGNVTAMVMRTNLTYGRPLNQGLKTQDYLDAYEHEDDYSRHYVRKDCARWSLPNFFYHHTLTFPDTASSGTLLSSPEVSAIFIFIDTKILSNNFPVEHFTARHWNNLRETVKLATQSHDWVFVVGDQAIYSSGAKGGGRYFQKNLRPLLKDFNVDAYISGSDHTMEIIEDGNLVHINCGNGGGGKRGAMRTTAGSVAFSNKGGYCAHILEKRHFTTAFVDGHTGQILEEFEKTRNHKGRTFASTLGSYNRLPRVTYTPLPPGIGGAPGSIADGRHPNQLFVLICGTIGLMCATLLFGVFGATVFRRIENRNVVGQKRTIRPVDASHSTTTVVKPTKTSSSKTHTTSAHKKPKKPKK